MIRINQIKVLHDESKSYDYDSIYTLMKSKSLKILRIAEKNIEKIEIIRHSIDARKKPEIYHIFMVNIQVNGVSEAVVVKKCRDNNISVVSPVKYEFPYELDEEKANKTSEDNKNKVEKEFCRPVIIGAGPAGLFCGYMLAMHGFKPLIFERGSDVDKRTELVEHFWESGELDEHSNVQFGEGGAGTFSDGKLNTMVKDKDGRGRKALEIFVKNGAPIDILYDAKPHIGTDILRKVVKNMRNYIINLGGEVRFDSQVDDIEISKDGRVKAVKVGTEKIPCTEVVLAIGHSARDTFYMLKDRKVEMNPKPFAVGFRVEHPQKLINFSQYGIAEPKALSPAPYKLTTTTDSGRGVYSFCMCPGGYVVNASSEKERLAVNGMSYSKRDSKNANSAIIITVDPKDFGSDDVLSGVEFQRNLEEKAFRIGNGKIPVEYYGDFKASVSGKENSLQDDEDIFGLNGNLPSMKGDYVFADVHEILPDDLNNAFVQGMEKFGKMIKGYNSDFALCSGVESRTSSPVRINRNEIGQSCNVEGLFPCGEGAGYAGGIMSAAMDGMKIAEFVARRICEK
ncbi:MAG: FAD-dependent oxidoreductase [Butyrivibrio sp.]|uniref:NAD(P)/FAD-dependent oxidoreductase n=1 Tax=Butyrivibrio sp. TaxID=28121 RepID=UPI001B274BE2|nr:NAD(P)-binding protein [Butyrivibrio sp.]MBO6240823.1 FAD-dependent oxidoreductase [Butyrivibrio sp.]